MTRPRIVVVGGGMGGLAAALDLACSGADVTLLERHAATGGKMRELEVGGHRIASGPTVFTMRWIFDALFARAGERLEEHVSLEPAAMLARHAWLDGSRLDLFADTERSAEAIAAFAGPGEARAYRRFVELSGRIFDTLDASFMRAERPGPARLARNVGIGGIPALIGTRPFVSLWNDLGRIFSDARLQQLFARYATYCGSSPFEAPATLMLIAEAERRGVWLIGGGIQRLAEAITSLIEARGATVRLGAHVEEIQVSDGRVVGVSLSSGETLGADAVVFNGDTRALAEGWMGEGVRSAHARPDARASLSALTLSLVAKTRGFPLAHHTVLFGDDYPGEFSAVFGGTGVCERPTVYVCAQDRGTDDTVHESPVPERLLCLVNAPARSLDETQVDAIERRLRDQLESHGVYLSEELDGGHRTGPNEFASAFPATDGALYGRPTHGWRGSFQRPGAATQIRGLYLAGGSVHPGAGIPMASQSGLNASAGVRRYLGLAP